MAEDEEDKSQAWKDVPLPYAIRDRFGRWNEAVRLAGLEPRQGEA
jgi:hypothetical protein